MVGPFNTLEAGTSVVWSHRISATEVDEFADLSGDFNPLHMDDSYARQFGFRGRVVHGMLVNSFLSRVLGMLLPGPGTLWLSQNTRFVQPVYIGDEIEIEVKVSHASPAL